VPTASGGTIFPNPTKAELWFVTNCNNKESAEIRIWDFNGKLISNSMINLEKGKNIIEIPGTGRRSPWNLSC
jgi:hypothetical protein